MDTPPSAARAADDNTIANMTHARAWCVERPYRHSMRTRTNSVPAADFGVATTESLPFGATPNVAVTFSAEKASASSVAAPSTLKTRARFSALAFAPIATPARSTSKASEPPPSTTAEPMTTWELNEALRARLARHCKEIEKLIAARDAAKAAAAYAQQLADLDAEVSFDSQVTMAEIAITRQLGASGPEADQNVNALLGEYARTMRLLKLEKKVTPDQATTMLLGGTYLDQPAVVSKALELGAEVNGVSDRDPLRRTALLLAIQTGHTSLLKQLAAANAEFTVADAEGDTALHYAVRSGNLSVIKAMLAKNDVNKTNKAGETALFIAVRRNQKPLVSALIMANADVKLSNANSLTAMDAACIAGSRDVLDLSLIHI